MRTQMGIKILIVDAYGWLHAGKAVNGVVELLSEDLPCPPLYAFIERRMAALSLGGKFQIILIFDGPSSIQKDATESAREQNRVQLQQLAQKLREDGELEKSTKAFRSSVDITPNVAKKLIDHLNSLSVARRKEIGYKRSIVSINEADPLLAYLNKTTPNSCVVSRDYDVVPWGATFCCFKVDYISGMVELFIRDVFDITAVVSKRELIVTQHQLIDICVLAGCDYVQNLRNEGFKKACNNIRKYGESVCICLCECMYIVNELH